MNSCAALDARECIECIRSRTSASKFGYKIQALAAHVLLGLGYRVDQVNHSGHPDIVANLGGRQFHFEVEAEVMGPRPRKLTDDDLTSLTNIPNTVGYFAFAICYPTPYWVLVPASKLIHRKLPSSKMLLEALSDTEFSEDWTDEFVRLLNSACRRIKLATFSDLSQMALAGKGL